MLGPKITTVFACSGGITVRDDGVIVPPGGDVTESDSMVSITRREETDDVFDDTESSITSVSQAAAGKLVRKGLRMAPLCRPACHFLRLFHF